MMTGRQFEQAITELGMSQSGAARFLDVQRATVIRYINDERRVPPSMAMLLTLMLRFHFKPNNIRKWAKLPPVEIGDGRFLTED